MTAQLIDGEFTLPERYKSEDYGLFAHAHLNLVATANVIIGVPTDADQKLLNQLGVIQNEWLYVNNDVVLRVRSSPDPAEKRIQIASFPSELFYRRKEAETLAYFGDTEPSWVRCFALLAMAYLEVVETFMLATTHAKNKDDRFQLCQAAGSMMALASEAIAYADRSGEHSFVEAAVREAVSQRGKAAAKQRHAPTDAIKKRFLEFYTTRTDGAVAKTVRDFFKTLAPEERKLFSETNFVRTFSEAARSWRRAQGR